VKATLKKINSLVDLGLIKKYAIAGGIAQFYYIEPSVTYDLDLIINLGNDDSSLAPLNYLYDWGKLNNYKTVGEHIVIEGIPVQFLLVYNELIAEALENCNQISLFGEKTFILSPEYLMAIMLQTGRATDKERLVRFFKDAEYNDKLFNEIVNRFGLIEKYSDFKRKHGD
jgi:hypothetical protein